MTHVYRCIFCDEWFEDDSLRAASMRLILHVPRCRVVDVVGVDFREQLRFIIDVLEDVYAKEERQES